MRKHNVKQGEYLSQIAAKYGFSDYMAIWDDPENAKLKAQRVNPNILYPGDILYIPKKSPKQESIPTDQKHRFRVHGHEIILRLVLKNADRIAIANTDCQLSIGFKTYNLTTDNEGKVEHTILTNAKKGELIIGDMVVPIMIGKLDPIEKLSGWQARLNNLGYNAGSLEFTNEEQIKSAVEEFQCDHGLAVDGNCGPKTQQKIVEVHGC